MAQTSLGKQAAQRLRAQRRIDDYRNYDDLSMLKRVMANQGNPDVEYSRDLTIQDKELKKSKSGVDEMVGQLSSFILDSENKVRRDLTNKEIKELKTHIDPLKKSSERLYNREGNFEVENYTNSQFNKLINTLDGMIEANNIENDLGVIEQQIKNLGDPTSYIHPRHGENVYLERGEYDISEGAKTILDNIRTLSDNYREVEGDNVKDLFAPFEEELNKKFAVFEDMDYYKSPEAQEMLATSPKAQAAFNEALRLFNTKGEEDITEISELLDTIPTELGATGQANLKAAMDKKKADEKSEMEKLDKGFESQVTAALNQVRAVYQNDKSMNRTLKNAMQGLPAITKGALGDEGTAKMYENQFANRLTVILESGVKVVNKYDADEKFNIQKAIERNDFETIYDYFTDSTPLPEKFIKELSDDARIKTYGQARLQNIVSGGKSGIKQENAVQVIGGLLKAIEIIRGRYGESSKVDFPELEADAGGAPDMDGDGIPDMLDPDAIGKIR